MYVGHRHVVGAIALALDPVAVDARAITRDDFGDGVGPVRAPVQRYVRLDHAHASFALDDNQVARVRDEGGGAAGYGQKEQLDGLLENGPRGHMDERAVVREGGVEGREGPIGEGRVLAEVLTDEVGRIDERLRETVEANAVRKRRRKRTCQKAVDEDQSRAVAEEERLDRVEMRDAGCGMRELELGFREC